ncbi:hypothetical protein OBBRIDRAFT_749481 [Obba rivulosa]|uniref:Transmembrane protein n=1 Tax=Obba rivulosa TaxID=1052685 RepID=A0A8E2J2R9_9APHY|nr:hypothetical protein OBBRIDRAFT_749481 [Obba rivulosa]
MIEPVPPQDDKRQPLLSASMPESSAVLPPYSDIPRYVDDPERGEPLYVDIQAMVQPVTPQKKRSCARRCHRFCLALCGTLLLLICLPVFLRHLTWFRDFTDSYMETEIDPVMLQDCVEYGSWMKGRMEWANPHHPLRDLSYIASTSFELPLDSDLLYMISRGALSHGTVSISDGGEQGSDKMEVHVRVQYAHEDALEKTKVCLLKPGENQNGVGIFSPPYMVGRKWHTNVEIDVKLPRASGIPIFVKKFETDMPLFKHNVFNMQETAVFNSISLRTSNMPIMVTSLAAGEAALETTNGIIEGTFKTETSLKLQTSNAPIKAEVYMLNADNGNPTQLWMHTSNGRVDAISELISTSESGTNGTFEIDARTSNSPLYISTRSAPIDHALDLTALTSNSPAAVSLHTTWEGSFDLRSSSLFTPNVDAHTAVPDPAGRNRKRGALVSGVQRGVVEGFTEWTRGEGRKVGQAKVATSNSPLTFSF